MPFLTKPAVTKGEPSSFALVKSQLVSLVPKVSLDTFFADTTNWQRVTVHYQNTHGQEEVLVFDALLQNPTATFSVTDKARSDYQITKIIIRDLDDGIFVIARSDLSAEVLADLDVSIQEVITARAIQWDSQNTAYETFGVGGVRTTLSRSGPGNSTPLLGEVLSGNFSIEFIIPPSTTTAFYHAWGIGIASETEIMTNFKYFTPFAGIMYMAEGTNPGYSLTHGHNAISLLPLGIPPYNGTIAVAGESFVYRLDKIGTTIIHYKNNIEIHRNEEPIGSTSVNALLVKPIINLPGRSDNNGNDSTIIVTVTALT